MALAIILLEKLTAPDPVIQYLVFLAVWRELRLHVKHRGDPVRRPANVVTEAVHVAACKVVFGHVLLLGLALHTHDRRLWDNAVYDHGVIREENQISVFVPKVFLVI